MSGMVSFCPGCFDDAHTLIGTHGGFVDMDQGPPRVSPGGHQSTEARLMRNDLIQIKIKIRQRITLRS
jgi:hypothetical protein